MLKVVTAGPISYFWTKLVLLKIGIVTELLSSSGETLLSVATTGVMDSLKYPAQYSTYSVLFIPAGKGSFYSDFGVFPFEGPVLLFSTPLQTIYLEGYERDEISLLQFHGDFYCIEYHRLEVACNGLLFNNIYLQPIVRLSESDVLLVQQLVSLMTDELSQEAPSELVLRATVQLFLAKASSIKLREEGERQTEKDEAMEDFRNLLDEHYLTLRRPADYAGLLAMSPNNFTKRCTRYFRKSPTQLIQERLLLEAKKQLHLTRKSIKEIAYSLHFKDEFYFSRMFKKLAKVSPQAFRDRTGISIVADKSK